MKNLAEAILIAAMYREESYDKDAANDAKKKLQTCSEIITDSRAVIDYSKFYTLSLYDACDKAAHDVGFDERGTQPVYLLLIGAWNEAIDWAKSYKEGRD